MVCCKCFPTISWLLNPISTLPWFFILLFFIPQSSTLVVVSPKSDHGERVLSKGDAENMEKSVFLTPTTGKIISPVKPWEVLYFILL